MVLPRFVVLKSNHNKRFLHYTHEDIYPHESLNFYAKEVVSPYVKFEVEMAKSGNGLVHLRCCYNNKYWVRRSENDCFIVATADKPEEDQSKWSCTLFKPVYTGGDSKTVRFLYVQLGHYACLGMPGVKHYDICLYGCEKAVHPNWSGVCTIMDWESLLIMPKHVAFKGDNGCYLGARFIEGHQYLQFSSNDIGDPTVGNEVFTTHDGSIRIKSDYFGKFWRRSPNWIGGDTDDTTSNNPDALFWPIKVENNVIALRNLGNNNFCNSLTTEGKTSCLNAAVSTISREARIEVEELVISRKIYNVNFRLMDAKFYNQRVLTMATGVATQEPNTIVVKLSHTDTKRRAWNSSVSLKLGVKTIIETGIPIIADGKIEISTEFSGAYQWGETIASTIVVETVYTVTVPPTTMVTMSALGTMGFYDVPFPYDQCDTLTNGQQIIHNMDDGIYTGNKDETKEEPKLMFLGNISRNPHLAV